MYLLEMHQADRYHRVGLFESRKDAIDWIESIPYVKKDIELFEEIEFISYTMNYNDLPLYEEIKWKTSSYPFTRFMFTPDGGDIELFIWDELSVMSKSNGYVKGMTQVDAYMVPNEEAKTYIKDREDLRKAITIYYNKLGKEIESGGLGSQDGEYLIIEDGPLIHLDALNINQWKENPKIEDFMDNLL